MNRGTVDRSDLPSHVPELAQLYASCGTGFELSLDVKDAAATDAVVAVARRLLGLDVCGGGTTIALVLEVKTAVTTSLTPDQVIAAAADFSDAREKLWSNCKNRYLQVHDSGADFAEVTEGFRLVTVFWERSRSDWSQPGTIRQTVIDSNVVGPRCTWELTATPNAVRTSVPSSRT